MHKKKYKRKKEKTTNVIKTSKYKYPKEHKTTKPRRGNRLQLSSVSSAQKLIKQENIVVDDFLWDLVSGNREKNNNQVMQKLI